MRRWLTLLAVAIGTAASLPARGQDVIKRVVFPTGAVAVELRGELRGRQGVRYRVPVQAGQTLEVVLKASNGSQAFNVLPPGAAEAMGRGDGGGAAAAWRLAGDGPVDIQTFLVRAAARRGERSTYTLTIRVTGAPLPALPFGADARVRGTAFHATAKLPCRRPYAATDGFCDAGVVRRGRDGTATVEIRDGTRPLRRLLFVQGALAVTDAPMPSTARREGDVTRIDIDDGRERYDVPEALLTGG